MRTRYAILLWIFLMFLANSAIAQQASPEAESQTAICNFQDDKELSVRYQPLDYNKKNEPVPGKAWAPGGAPIFLFTPTDLLLGNATIPTGAYSIYTIKDRNNWTLIVNRNVTQGAPYDEKQDIARLQMETTKLNSNKPLSVSLGHVQPKVCSLQIVYGDSGACAEFKEK